MTEKKGWLLFIQGPNLSSHDSHFRDVNKNFHSNWNFEFLKCLDVQINLTECGPHTNYIFCFSYENLQHVLAKYYPYIIKLVPLVIIDNFTIIPRIHRTPESSSDSRAEANLGYCKLFDFVINTF